MLPNVECQVGKELPRYRCFKEVHAIKIAAIGTRNGRTYLMPLDPDYPEFEVSPEYVAKHDPKPGGYFVLYNDGYQSWSPAKAFEEGYTNI